MKVNVFVDGAEGTTGLRIHEYLARRDDVVVLKIDSDKRKDPAERARLLNASDVAFLCLPDTGSREAVALTTNPNTLIIDASTAHRTHADWAYGLPELSPAARAKIRAVKRIGVPGCHATAFVLPVAPLVRNEVIAADTPLHAFSITGYSGGGKKMIAEYEAGAPKLSSPRPYGLGMVHKHLPEMKAHCGLTHAPGFVPVVAGFYKGLAVTTYLNPALQGTTAKAVHSCIADTYAREGNVRVLPLADERALDDGFFDVQACNDTNRVDVCVFGNDERVALVARLDNLGKGASGAAVQCMNVHLGLDENAFIG
jgi:N-acetyl-gamma-glutamyl-phosphate reductase